MKQFAAVLGAAMLAIGVGSPALGSVNEHGSTLVFFGLALLGLTIFEDSIKELTR